MSVFGVEVWVDIVMQQLKYLHILPLHQKLQTRQIQEQFALSNLTRVELGDPRKLLYTLDLTLF